MAEQCEHKQRNPEGVEWSNADTLDHFLHCLPEHKQRESWEIMQAWAAAGRMCSMQDHACIIERQRAYTLRLLTGIREVIERANTRTDAFAAWVGHRLQGLIS